MCIAHGHRQPCGKGQREGREWSVWRWAKGVGRGDICNSVKIKMFNKRTFSLFFLV